MIEKNPDFLQKTDVQWRRTAQRQGQAVTGQRIALGQGPQRMAMGTANADPVLRRDFQKVELAHRGGFQVFH
ncbi:hypothetical protein D3C84_1045470 [compost metagenome]